MSQDYKYRLDRLYDELGIATDEPFRVDDNRTMPPMVKRYHDVIVDENTIFRADENGDLYRFTQDRIWIEEKFCFCRLLSLCDYEAELVPVVIEEV